MLHNLYLRYCADDANVYTAVGGVLCSMNPYKPVAIYGPKHIAEHRSLAEVKSEGDAKQPRGRFSPHLYGLAEAAYAELLATSRDQALVMSGESGAGKTEACKLAMGYLASASAAASGPGGGAAGVAAERVSRCMVESNVVLEALGNAKTYRNDNSRCRPTPMPPPARLPPPARPALLAAPPPTSRRTSSSRAHAHTPRRSVRALCLRSRFGKWVALLMTAGGQICGGQLTTYLLESVRVTRQMAGERNYHAFYFLLAAAHSGEMQRLLVTDGGLGGGLGGGLDGGGAEGEAAELPLAVQWDLGGPRDYAYLRDSDCEAVAASDDVASFVAFCRGLRAVRIEATWQRHLFRLLAALLELGNVCFAPHEDHQKGFEVRCSCARPGSPARRPHPCEPRDASEEPPPPLPLVYSAPRSLPRVCC